MEYLIAGLGLIIGLFLIGYFVKRKYYNEVDKYETWKIDLMDRPVLDEMAKVKKLNMTGQTEELFERWRKEWDEIVTTELPNIEEYLFDAEEYTEKYRFRKAKEKLAMIEKSLEKIEENINRILKELNELVGSEEKNRNEIDSLKEQYRECRKNLLAHRHSFGESEGTLEEQLNVVLQMFQVFDEKTEKGNYLEAREIVLQIKTNLDEIVVKMELIPQFLHDCQVGLPSQIGELREGFREMTVQGYQLDHIGIEAEIGELEKNLVDFQMKINQTEIGEIQQGLEEAKQKVESFFDLLENEVMAKHKLSEMQPELNELFVQAVDDSEKIQEEINTVRQSYHVADNEVEAHSLAEKKLKQLLKKYEVLALKINQGETAFSFLIEELTLVEEELKSCQHEQELFKEKLNALRKDELEARGKVRELSREVTEMIKLISKSNLPGLSQNYKYLLEDAKESIQNVADRLEQKPLNIPTIQQYLEIAELTVEKLADTTKEMVENVNLAEKIIQYGNRYRSRYPSVANGLDAAEEAFRNYEYQQAIEKATAVIEEVEPGAIKKINELFIETHV
ncbi:septation ring formation regulator EzrA [Bacillus sp. B15-48]|uniref:septation ring formation regulator EzrA n=1 Tax=Bacillus sp. B15-48 TaxID=1548601 RepID=UPI00193F9A6E|nr:septation ring formation regulator EzrA [Bacillus sp. B15-48]MBM4762572.1 septation ring formation regulator EzrA [Bacillus sp. B15-48]